MCVCVCEWRNPRRKKTRWKEEGEVDPTVVVMGRRSRSSLNFHRTVPRWGPVGVVTIDSWPQLFRRLKKERLESSGVERHLFPTYISVCSRGQTTASLPTIWGHFTCFLTRLSRIVPFASPISIVSRWTVNILVCFLLRHFLTTFVSSILDIAKLSIFSKDNVARSLRVVIVRRISEI